jgi:hypothetical protein
VQCGKGVLLFIKMGFLSILNCACRFELHGERLVVLPTEFVLPCGVFEVGTSIVLYTGVKLLLFVVHCTLTLAFKKYSYS